MTSNEQNTVDHPTPELLSARIRRETTSDHRDAESGHFMKSLLQGEIPLTGYLDLLVQMREMYRVLEAVSPPHADDPVYGGFFDPVLFRLDALHADIDAVAAIVGGSLPGVADATQAFAAGVAAVAHDPMLLLAHHYTRYLGDLSGGVMIGKVVDRTYGFQGGPGATWSRFPAIDDLDAYKNAYRRRIDTLPIDAPAQALLVDEVHRAYDLNAGVIGALSARHG